MSNYTTICLMATFGGANYDDLADITQRLVRPMQHNHPSFSEAATIHLTPAWPREPQWMICWATDVASALSLWSGAGDVPYSTDVATVHKLQRDVWNLEIKLMKAASADCNLARRLQADLMVVNAIDPTPFRTRDLTRAPANAVPAFHFDQVHRCRAQHRRRRPTVSGTITWVLNCPASSLDIGAQDLALCNTLGISIYILTRSRVS